MSFPPLMENGPHDEATVVEQNDDEDELPSAHSPSEEVEENDEDTELQPKRQRRKDVDSTSRSSPLKGVIVDKEAGESSSDASEQEDPLSVPPLNSAPPTAFGKMASPPMSSEDEDINR